MQNVDIAQLDSKRVRCLAHPLRFRLLGALRLDGPATSTTLARRLDTNTGATSYHLRKLEEVGLVEEIENRGNARERWWQATHLLTSFRVTDFENDPTDHAAAAWLEGQHQRALSQWRDEWQSTRDSHSHEWRRAAGSSDYMLRLTPAQLDDLSDDLLAVVQSYREAGPSDGDDVRDVLILLDAFPVKDRAL